MSKLQPITIVPEAFPLDPLTRVGKVKSLSLDDLTRSASPADRWMAERIRLAVRSGRVKARAA